MGVGAIIAGNLGISRESAAREAMREGTIKAREDEATFREGRE